MKPVPLSATTHYRQSGYVILPELLDNEELNILRNCCDQLLQEPPDDDKGGTAHNIGRGHDRRFLRHRHKDFPELSGFILGQTMKQLLSGFIGKTLHLFNEQFVVKGPHTGASFAWHQDSAYVGFDHEPYITVWIALDDSYEDNGAVFVLPRDLDQEGYIDPHEWDLDGKEMVGYTGPDPGNIAEVPAGSVVLFSSVTLHRSSANITDSPRRAYIAQYSGQPLIDPETQQPKRFATPL